MVIFIVWEIYSKEWKLIRKGSRFMSCETPALIDVDVEDWGDDMAKAYKVEREQFVVTSIQQIDIRE